MNYEISVEAWHGVQFGRLSDPTNPQSPITPAGGKLDVDDVTEVPIFPQRPSRLERIMGPGINENPQDAEAFFLNIWAPQCTRNLPVLVFLHGGAWVSGGGSARWYRGAALARRGTVVVTLNYRIGPAGHLEDGAPDAPHRPIEDIVTALRWVKDNVAQYGGDPEKVTLSGQSAGAWYAWALAGWENARGLFSRLALMSIPQITPWTSEERSEFTRQVAKLTASGLDPLDAGAEVLGKQSARPDTISPMYLPVWPVSGPHTLLHVDALFARTTAHEMSVFMPHPTPGDAAQECAAKQLKAVERATAANFTQFTEAIVRSARRYISDVRHFVFGETSPLQGVGAGHCFDLPFQFGNARDWHNAPMLKGIDPTRFDRQSERLQQQLTDFVHARPDRPDISLPPTY